MKALQHKTNVVMPTDDILFKLPILIIPSHLQNKVKLLHCQQKFGHSGLNCDVDLNSFIHLIDFILS
jgi:hypothetical protein